MVDLVAIQLRAALQASGCPICRVVAEWLRQYFFWFFTQNYAEPAVLSHLEQAGGFCGHHGYRVITSGEAYQIAHMNQHLLSHLRRELETRGSRPSHRANRISPASRRTCPACEKRDEAAAAAVKTLLAQLSEQSVRTALEDCGGLCFPHWRQALADADAEASQVLVNVQNTSIKRLEAELAEYTRKVGYQYAHEPKGEEQTAWIRATELISGKDY